MPSWAPPGFCMQNEVASATTNYSFDCMGLNVIDAKISIITAGKLRELFQPMW